MGDSGPRASVGTFELPKGVQTVLGPEIARCRFALRIVAILFTAAVVFENLVLESECPTTGDDSAAPQQVVGGISPNDAAWYELAQLPSVGYVMARRIVIYRQSVTIASPGGELAFVRPEDLQRVRGIGNQTIRKIEPFLRF